MSGRPPEVVLWDREAASFDDAPDHGLADPAVRRAWSDLLGGVLPAAPTRVVDLGCGTGTLSVLLAEHGHAVTGLDFSEPMVARARAKAVAAGLGPDRVRFAVADAATPPLTRASADVVLARHVLWAMPDPAAALRLWLDLLVPDGLLVLVEGRWATEAGLTGAQTTALVEGAGCRVELTPLDDPVLWGRETGDERYLVVGRPVRPG